MAWLILAGKVFGIAAAVLLGLFVITFTVYFFNLDMKLMAALIKPLTFWYDWSKKRRDAKKAKKLAREKQGEKA